MSLPSVAPARATLSVRAFGRSSMVISWCVPLGGRPAPWPRARRECLRPRPAPCSSSVRRERGRRRVVILPDRPWQEGHKRGTPEARIFLKVRDQIARPGSRAVDGADPFVENPRPECAPFVHPLRGPAVKDGPRVTAGLVKGTRPGGLPRRFEKTAPAN